MKVKVFLSGTLALCAGCSSIGQKGTVTIEGRGASALSQKGDPLMGTGVYAKKEVSADFAAGYQKGIGDAAWREYWSLQDRPSPAPARPKESGAEGKTNYYPVELPESTDAEGVTHAPRQVTVPVVEFIRGGKGS